MKYIGNIAFAVTVLCNLELSETDFYISQDRFCKDCAIYIISLRLEFLPHLCFNRHIFLS